MRNDLVKTDDKLQDKKVHVMKNRKILHTGIVLGEDKVFKNTILVGLTETSLNITKKPGQQFISIYRAKQSELKLA